MSEFKLKTKAIMRENMKELIASDDKPDNWQLALISDIDACLAEIERLRDVIQFYANVDHYKVYESEPDESNNVMADSGKRAREALK